MHSYKDKELRQFKSALFIDLLAAPCYQSQHSGLIMTDMFTM